MAEDRKRIPVTGRHSIKDDKVAPDHMGNFNKAIQNALDEINWPISDHHGVTVQLSATLTVTNPGTIIEYCATLV